MITGGNGGIGLGIAEGLASSGCNVAILGRNEEKNQLSKDLLEKIGTKIEAYPDVAHRTYCLPLFGASPMYLVIYAGCRGGACLRLGWAWAKKSQN